MKHLSKRLLAMLCAATLLAGTMVPAAAADAPKPTLWIVGDSTVCDFGDTDASLYYPRYGYGTQIENYLDGTYEVKNLALSGRSSKSFLGEDNYAALKASIKAGDALIIGFGHNDEKAEEARYTDPNGDWQTEGSFAKSLYDNYVKVAQDAKAEAILCTPMVRRSATGEFSSSELHVTKESGNFKGGDYPAAIRKLGTDKNVAVVDLTAATKDLYDKLTPAETLYLHSWGSSKPESVDPTHPNIYGAKMLAWLLANGIKDNTVSTTLASHIDLSKGEPTKAADLVVNPDYKELEYAPPSTESALGEPYTAGEYTFKPTALGDLGGNPTTDKFIMETDAAGNLHMKVIGKGKIASSTDGMAMYYYQLPVGAQFKLTATATFNGLGTASNPGQSAFGLIARDDMWIDKYDKTIVSDYVAAGTFGDGSSNCYYRKSGKLGPKVALTTEKLEAGKSYDLSIVSNTDGFACTFGSEPTQTGGFDFALNSVDSKYFYVGMFAARDVDVTFSNIKLEIISMPEVPDEPAQPDQPDVPGGSDLDAVAGGWFETLFAEIKGVSDADVTAVSWSGDATGSLTGDDLAYLVRDMTGGVRVDIPGLKAGTYDLKLTVKGKSYTFSDITVQAHDRSGFAHYNYTEGVGAYNDDGTLKDNAVVLYVTEENKDTVKLTVGGKTVTGIGSILNTKGYADNKAEKILHELTKANKPLVVRIIGNVTTPAGVSKKATSGAGSFGGSDKDNGGMCTMQNAKDLTIEGIGTDATVNGWGFNFNAGGQSDGSWGKNFEVRNVAFRNVPEDCIGMEGKSENGEITESVEHCWVHNCEFYVPSITDPAESDKAQGDGAVDFKCGRYMTLSYNFFQGYHKTSLLGGGDTQPQHHVTWHHNYWKNCESRGPLVRQADMHIYNNLYEGQKAYCMSLRANAYVFSEFNTFLKCNDPVKNETKYSGGGVCKSYQDVFDGCKGTNDATKVTDKAQTVTSANKYANFDTDATLSYIPSKNYKLDTIEQAEKNIILYSGVMENPKTLVKPDGSTTPVDPTPVAVTGVTLNKTTASVNVGKSVTLVATVAPDNAADKGVYWFSSDTKIVTVDQTGKASGVKEGSASVTVRTDDGNFTASCNITVTTAGDSGNNNSSGGSGGGSSSGKKANTVTAADGTKVTTTTDRKGNTTVTAVAADGSKVETVTAKDGDKAITVSDAKGETQVAIKLPADIPAPKEKFTDVPAGHWAEKSINDMAGLGMVNGVNEEANLFDMTSPVTRGSIATILFRFSNGAAGKTTNFTDVSGGQWYTDAIGWAAETGVVTGYSETTFAPNDTITREQLAVMLTRFAKLIGMDTDASKAPLGSFTDGASTHLWAMDGMAWCVSKGIITGKLGSVLDPSAAVSRAEAAVMFDRMIGLLK